MRRRGRPSSRTGSAAHRCSSPPPPRPAAATLVDPKARGRRLGARLVDTCLDFARAASYSRMVLWTNHPLAAARSIYLAAGFRLTAEEPHHSYGVDLIGQTYELALQP